MANTVNSPKPKLPVLVLPAPHRISGDVNAMLESTISERFMTISLVPHTEKDVSKGKLVLSHTPSKEDPKVLASNWNNALGHLVRFIQPMVDAWASGIGLSGDGSALYVAKHAETIYKIVPAIKGYDLYMVPNSRAGAAKYRVSITELVAQVMNRATSIKSSIDTFGVAVGKERTTKAEQAPEITVIL